MDRSVRPRLLLLQSEDLQKFMDVGKIIVIKSQHCEEQL